MRGAIHPLPQYSFIVWCSIYKSTGTTLRLPFQRERTMSDKFYRQREGSEKILFIFPIHQNNVIMKCSELTNCMQPSPSSQAKSHSASQEILRLLWNPKVHYHVHKGPPLVPLLSHMHPVHKFPPCLPKIFPNVILPSGLFPSGFPKKISYFSSLPCDLHVSPILSFLI
jgi:hypothetical protein